MKVPRNLHRMVIVLSLPLALGLIGCGKENEPNPEQAEQKVSTPKSVPAGDITSFTFTQNPIVLRWETTGTQEWDYEIEGCRKSDPVDCDAYLKFQCIGKTLCTVVDGMTGKARSNYEISLQMSSSSGKTVGKFQDNYFTYVSRDEALFLRIRRTDISNNAGPWVEAGR